MNQLKIMRILSQLFLTLIILGGVFFLLIKFKVISFNSSSLPEVITLNQTELGIKANDDFQLIATVYPDDVYYGKISWTSSDPEIASVNETTGYVTAHKSGTVIITASVPINNLKAECNVLVSGKDIALEHVNITSEQISLLIGKTYAIKYSFSPNNATTHNFEYTSSDESVAIIDNKGLITAKGVGSAIITMKSRNSSAKDTVVVKVYSKTNNNTSSTKPSGSDSSSKPNQPVNNETITGVNLSKTSLSLVVGGTSSVTATVVPKNANQSITWTSSNQSVAKVDKNGTITGVSIGDANIIATSINGKNAHVKVTVSDGKISLTNIDIKNDTMSINLGDTKKIDILFYPNNSTNQSVTCSSSDNEILKVDNYGNITPISSGSAIVTCVSADGGYRDFITIEVKDVSHIIPETSITFSDEKISLPINKTITLNPIILPSNATYKSIIWSTSNRNIATVDDGLVYGLSKGSVIITAKTKNAGLIAKITIDVKEIKSSGVTLNKNEANIKVGETIALMAVVVPNDASDKSVIWSSSDQSIVKLSENGIVEALKPGRAVITVKTKDTNKQASAIINVSE